MCVRIGDLCVTIFFSHDCVQSLDHVVDSQRIPACKACQCKIATCWSLAMSLLDILARWKPLVKTRESITVVFDRKKLFSRWVRNIERQDTVLYTYLSCISRTKQSEQWAKMANAPHSSSTWKDVLRDLLEGLDISDKTDTENVSISWELWSVSAPIFSWLITHKTNAQGTRNVDDADGCKQLGS